MWDKYPRYVNVAAMKVIDLQLYRNRRAILELEQRIGNLTLSRELGTADKLKTCFREWLQKTKRA